MWRIALIGVSFSLVGCQSVRDASHGCQHLVKEYSIAEQKRLGAELRKLDRSQFPAVTGVVVDFKAMRDACRQ